MMFESCLEFLLSAFLPHKQRGQYCVSFVYCINRDKLLSTYIGKYLMDMKCVTAKTCFFCLLVAIVIPPIISYPDGGWREEEKHTQPFPSGNSIVAH